MTLQRLKQVWTIARLQLGRVFFSKRSFWVYILALFPTIMFIGHGLDVKFRQSRWAGRVTPAAVLESIRDGDSDEEVLRKAPNPIEDRTWNINRRRGRRAEPEPPPEPARRFLSYYDGSRRWNLNFEAGILQGKGSSPLIDFDEDRQVFAGVFQYFYLRLAIFFGCVGIFMNLFRGEMMDKTLHFWFLVPARREVLLAGKYLSGLIAATVIFAGGSALCFGAMLWYQDPVQAAGFWNEHGLNHLFWYAASAALACVGYGSVFLAAGLLLRNPMVPAVVILSWESINNILPATLQKLSVLYYVQALCPVPAPMDPHAPLLIRLLQSPAEPPPVAVAVLGLFAVTLLVLWAAAVAVRKLEINYSTD